MILAAKFLSTLYKTSLSRFLNHRSTTKNALELEYLQNK
jgi:hypothetical protein